VQSFIASSGRRARAQLGFYSLISTVIMKDMSDKQERHPLQFHTRTFIVFT
ncbi:hypothetical protein Tsp_03039, partial [Trichinella spiralis]|uniref:hypothetical protein n=1 Tax=Trichinella spiralis TaxID=6334 RepID=UPI0001EFB5FE